VINMRAEGVGLIVGHKSFERPLGDGVKLLHALHDVYTSTPRSRWPEPCARRLRHSPSIYVSAVGVSLLRTGGAKSEPRLPQRVSLTSRGSTTGSDWRTHRLTRAATALDLTLEHWRQYV
jgi:hypothetical protein